MQEGLGIKRETPVILRGSGSKIVQNYRFRRSYPYQQSPTLYAVFITLHIIQLSKLPFCQLWRTSGSALISSLKYLNLHFHNQTAGLSMSYMNTSKNKANRLNYELFICLSYSQTSQAPQSFHMVTLRPQFDGSKLNTDSIENFYIIIISCNSPFNIRHIIT